MTLKGKISQLKATEISHDPSEQGNYESGYKSAIEEVLQILSEPADVMGAAEFLNKKWIESDATIFTNRSIEHRFGEHEQEQVKVIDLLNEFASLQKPVGEPLTGWISVEKELPRRMKDEWPNIERIGDISIIVLALDDKENVQSAFYDYGSKTWHGTKFEEDLEDEYITDGDKFDKITHWQKFKIPKTDENSNL